MQNKKVLVVYYSQTGQLTSVVKSIAQAIESDSIEVVYECVQPETPYPFPWPLLKFFDVFPESVYLDPPPIKPLTVDPGTPFDLVIIAYQAWFLAPSLPITAFLKSPQAKQLLAGRPVVTVIACRDMWLMAQEKVKKLLQDVGARLTDNVALVDQGSSLVSFITTPRWMLTGNKDSGGILPPAGVSEKDIREASRFGRALAAALHNDEEKTGKPLLQGLGAVHVDPRLISSEKFGQRSFTIWGKLIRSLGPPGDPKRKPVLIIYMVFLIFAILTVVPINMILKTLLRPLFKASLLKQKAYYEQPSGSRTHRMQEFLRGD